MAQRLAIFHLSESIINLLFNELYKFKDSTASLNYSLQLY